MDKLSNDILIKLIISNEMYYKNKINIIENKLIQSKKTNIINTIKYIYLEKYNKDDYLEWLDNDMVIWLNNNIPTIYSIEDKLIDFIDRIPEIKLHSFINGTINPDIVVDIIFYNMTMEELNDFNTFINISYDITI